MQDQPCFSLSEGVRGGNHCKESLVSLLWGANSMVFTCPVCNEKIASELVQEQLQCSGEDSTWQSCSCIWCGVSSSQTRLAEGCGPLGRVVDLPLCKLSQYWRVNRLQGKDSYKEIFLQKCYYFSSDCCFGSRTRQSQLQKTTLPSARPLLSSGICG